VIDGNGIGDDDRVIKCLYTYLKKGDLGNKRGRRNM
jgi:hypothetical protein